MAPKHYPYLDTDGNLGIRAGDDWGLVLTFDDGAATPVLYDFTDCSAVLQVYSKKGVKLLEITSAAGQIILGGAAGTLEIKVTDTVTAALTAGIYEYGLKITDSDAEEHTWLAGAFEVAKELVP